jgi:hypothetical protein
VTTTAGATAQPRLPQMLCTLYARPSLRGSIMVLRIE